MFLIISIFFSANIVIGSGSLLGRLLSLPLIGKKGSDTKNIPLSLSPLQEERLRNLQQRLEVPFDGTRLEHQAGFIPEAVAQARREKGRMGNPFAIAGINISFMLAQMLDLQSGRPTSLAGVRFLELLGEDEMAFNNLYCVSFQMMDAQWLAKRASYMEFNVSTVTLHFIDSGFLSGIQMA
ncbi:uncharacterized protein LOC131238607 [Magnolia sinica]|uniref:uncharacterized protein LOC131238607 n=1 Tax=Magnolia sinica TaxID=86752 RepID=UPI00265B27C8|nr:uncharacterized protein LOC131238607 [Magnolia sinica]